ncbi:guanylate kinase [candidate division KSB1 bacterium]
MLNKLIILSGPSGTGKSTLARHLLNIIPELEFSISACSRSKRNNEIDGKHYYFITVEQFREKINNNEFIEWEEVYDGQYYGTLKTEIERIGSQDHHVIFDVDINGALRIKELYAERALAIIIIPPSMEELKVRLLNRSTEDRASMTKRLEKSRNELDYAKQFDKIIVNDNLEKSKTEIEKFVRDFLNS